MVMGFGSSLAFQVGAIILKPQNKKKSLEFQKSISKLHVNLRKLGNHVSKKASLRVVPRGRDRETLFARRFSSISRDVLLAKLVHHEFPL